ncbi:MAG: DNA polymerase III subunit delta' [Lachnospiraceae bacterium]|nr:DNA polymerase III subunit delta' [Lachnospiraceae bacterium]
MAKFKDIIGQEQIKEHLQSAITMDKVSHAYILHGELGAGKEYIARIFAMTLQCEKGGTDPCGECRSCKQAESKNHPDIIWVSHEKPNSIGVEDIRSQINNDMEIKPYYGPRKIYIINEAQKMTPQAQNALLKTLEEPPAYGIIMLLTTNIDALLSTIVSRCVVLNMRPVKDRDIEEYLMKQLQVPDYKAKLCAAFARGNTGKAKHLAENEDFDRIKEEAVSLLKYINDMEIAEIVTAIKRINEYKLDVNSYMDILFVWFRDILLFKATKEPNDLIFKEEIQYIRKIADRSSYEGIETILNALDKTQQRIAANVNFDLAMELLFLTVKENS